MSETPIIGVQLTEKILLCPMCNSNGHFVMLAKSSLKPMFMSIDDALELSQICSLAVGYLQESFNNLFGSKDICSWRPFPEIKLFFLFVKPTI